ncbi:MAG: hypothetical protein KJ964_06700 [Verrucomicrobia bacterium]|nr:hypothetical protein [Verrucomicrobiota bacterium]MBU1735121.1 hypothetical protein [Verrucomicrobiota bacterium]MBU1856363.1 hypothetical protein [Verrucomicrobiota bacterium]
MCAEPKDSGRNGQPWLLRHLAKWQPLYETAGVVSVVVAIIVGGISLRQTQKAVSVAVTSLSLSSKSVELQEKEFTLRNRPLIVIGSYEFSGPAGDKTGKTSPRSVKTHLVNISDIPATHLKGTFDVKLNGKTIGIAPLATTALAKDSTRTLTLGLSEELYSAATNSSNYFETTTHLTYSGMLGEAPDQYLSRDTVYWSSLDQHFISRSEEPSYK